MDSLRSAGLRTFLLAFLSSLISVILMYRLSPGVYLEVMIGQVENPVQHWTAMSRAWAANCKPVSRKMR